MNYENYKKQLLQLLDEIHDQQEKHNAGHPAKVERRDLENTEEDDLTETEQGFRVHNILEDLNAKEKMVKEALERIEQKTFGICLNCHKKIEEKRLDAISYTKYCIECQTKLEEASE
ncbi:hypothetical protein HGA91_06675 [candidate division WWE3 bacterium]|nr:hypothetical protein [candidate division WWE3 bacterium]